MKGKTSLELQQHSCSKETQQKLSETVSIVDEAAFPASYLWSSIDADWKAISSVYEKDGIKTASCVSASEKIQQRLEKAGVSQPYSEKEETEQKPGEDSTISETKSEERELDQRLSTVDHSTESVRLSSSCQWSSIHADYKDRSGINENERTDTSFHVNIGEESQRKLQETDVYTSEEVGFSAFCPWSSIQTDYKVRLSGDETDSINFPYGVNVDTEKHHKPRTLTVTQPICQVRAMQQKFEAHQEKSEEKKTRQNLREAVHVVEEVGSPWSSLPANCKNRTFIDEEKYIEAKCHVNFGEEAQDKLRNAIVTRPNFELKKNQQMLESETVKQVHLKAKENIHNAEEVEDVPSSRWRSIDTHYSDSSSVDGKDNIEVSNHVYIGAAWRKVEFLEVCHLCKRHLTKDLDIFMYRGDQAFCSEECRQKQIFMDQKFLRSRWKVSSSKADRVRHSSPISPAVSL